MNTHEMRLHPGPFERIKNGTQVIESRLNDDRRQKIKVGDQLVFVLRPDFIERIEAEVVELIHAPSFKELFVMRPIAEFGADDVETKAESMYEYYSKEEEVKYGVLGIKFKKL